MKATGEVMAIAPTFEQAIMKRCKRCRDFSRYTRDDKEFAQLSNASVYDRLSVCDDKREFSAYMRHSREALL